MERRPAHSQLFVLSVRCAVGAGEEPGVAGSCGGEESDPVLFMLEDGQAEEVRIEALRWSSGGGATAAG